MLGFMKRAVRSWLDRLGLVVLPKGTVDPQFLVDLTPEEHATVRAVQDRSMLGPHNVAMLCRCIEHIVKAEIAGDIVECGVWRGGAVMAMLRTLLRCKDLRTVWLYDTFSGMTKPTAADVDWTGKMAATIYAEKVNGWAKASFEDVQAGVRSVGYPEHLIHFVRGKVEDTIPGIIPDHVA